MNLNLKEILQFLENLFFPSVCEGCGKVGSYLCDKCAKDKIEIRRGQQCHVCKEIVSSGLVHKKCKKKTNLDGVFVIAEYSKFVENYIGDIKYEFYFAMIGDLVRVMNLALEKNADFLELVKESVLTFVPLSPVRKRWRGFNQAERIAQGIAKYWHKECLKLLRRTRNTKSQVGLKRRERLRNVRGVFETVSSAHCSDVFIVDDVMTSGGTLEECAKVLKAVGYRRVYGLVFARG